MKKTYQELKNSIGYKQVFESLNKEITKNKISLTPSPIAEILDVHRHLLLEFVESEGWTVSEYYCQGDESGAHWGWTATGVFPNYNGMNELAKELGNSF